MPKIHSIHAHAVEQMKRLQGIGDMLEDDVEHVYQMAARIEMQASRMNKKALEPFIHSKVETIQNSQAMKKKIALSQQHAKRAFKKGIQKLFHWKRIQSLRQRGITCRLRHCKTWNQPHLNLNRIKF
jgi:hypothetical protein